MESIVEKARRIMNEQLNNKGAIENEIPDRAASVIQTVDYFGKMTLKEFACSGIVIHIHSDVLGCDVIFAADNATDESINTIDKNRGYTVYRARELFHILRLNPNDLILLHTVKATFKGEIIE